MEVDESTSFFTPHNNWDDLLHPKSMHDMSFPDRSIQNNHPQNSYQDIDSSLSVLRGSRASSSSQHIQQRPSQISPVVPPNFENSENLDMDSQNYDFFASSSNSYGAKYRSFSSAPSINPSPALSSYGQDLLYANGSNTFHDTSLNGSASPYETGISTTPLFHHDHR